MVNEFRSYIIYEGTFNLKKHPIWYGDGWSVQSYLEELSNQTSNQHIPHQSQRLFHNNSTSSTTDDKPNDDLTKNFDPKG